MGCGASIQALANQVVEVAEELNNEIQQDGLLNALENEVENRGAELAEGLVGELGEVINAEINEINAEQRGYASGGSQMNENDGDGASEDDGGATSSPSQPAAPLNQTQIVTATPQTSSTITGRQPDKNYATNTAGSAKALSLDDIKLQAKQKVDQIVADCTTKNSRFVDSEFPPISLSLWHNPYDPPSADEILQPVNWRRLTDMSPTSSACNVFQGDGPKAADIVQGGIGTCFLISALSVLTAMRPDIVKDLFVAFDVSKGVFAIRFWKEGEWKYVVVDDYVPTTLTTQTHRLVPAFAYSPDDITMWLSLLEKAYAKIHSSYENIDGGFSNYAMCDWTGGYSMQIHLDDPNSSPIMHVGKFTSTKDETFYLSFYNGKIVGGGLDGPHGTMMREFRIYGTYNVSDFTVSWDYIPVADKFSGPENYRKYTGKFDPVNKTITGKWIEDRTRTVSASPVQYSVSYSSDPSWIDFQLTQQFASDDERQEPTVFDPLFYFIKHSLDKKILMSSSAHPATATAFEEKTPEGLLLKHEYSVVTVFTIPNTNENVIQIRNPHGKGSEEWNGSWSDGSSKWDAYPDLKKQYVNAEGDEDDGVFCMAFDDWRTRFTHCNMTRIFEPGWNYNTFKGMLVPSNCGLTGNINKPKYYFKTQGPSTRIVITLSQPDNKRFENTEDYEIAIGLRIIMELKTLGNDPEYDKEDTIVICEFSPSYDRQVSVELTLEEINTGMGPYFRGEGSYYILPITHETNIVLPYVLNISSFNTALTINTMKHINQPPVDPTSLYTGDLYAKWYYDTYVPEFESYLDLQYDYGASPSISNPTTRAKGRKDLLRAKVQSEMARAKGRSGDEKSKGQSNMDQVKGRSEMARAKGRNETARAKGRSELARAKAPNLAIGSQRDAAQAEAPQTTPTADPNQDQLEENFKRDYAL